MDKVMHTSHVPVPREGKVWRLTVGTSSEVWTVPTAWHGQWLEIEAAAEVDLVFADNSSVALTLDQASSTSGSGTSGSPYVLTANDATGKKFTESAPKQVYCSGNDKYLAAIAAAAGTDVEVRIA